MTEQRGGVDDRRGFHIEKSVSVGHLMTTVSIIVSMIWWASTVETRLAVTASDIQTMKAQAQTTREDVRDSLKEIKDALREMNNKLDPRRP